MTSCFLRLLEKGVLERLVSLLLVLVILTDLILSNLNSGVLKLSLLVVADGTGGSCTQKKGLNQASQ